MTSRCTNPAEWTAARARSREPAQAAAQASGRPPAGERGSGGRCAGKEEEEEQEEGEAPASLPPTPTPTPPSPPWSCKAKGTPELTARRNWCASHSALSNTKYRESPCATTSSRATMQSLSSAFPLRAALRASSSRERASLPPSAAASLGSVERETGGTVPEEEEEEEEEEGASSAQAAAPCLVSERRRFIFLMAT